MKKFQILVSVVILIAIIFIARLSYFQIFSEKYLLNGLNTSVKTDIIIPQRGLIFDRTGKILVGNTPNYEIVVTKDLITDDFNKKEFCDLLGISSNEFDARMNSLEKEKYFKSYTSSTFMKNIPEEEAFMLEERFYRFKGFKIQNNPDRSYNTEFAGNVLGYINQASERDIKKDSLYYNNGDKIGKAGVERSYEPILRGSKGKKYVEKDIHQKSIGSYKDGKYDEEVISGKDITITIDMELQELAEQMLTNKRGSVVALDPKTGEILCLASSPGYSPKEISGEHKQENLYRLLNDSFQKPMYDRALQAAYPPGSTFKMLTGLAGMQMGVIDTGTSFLCRHGFYLGSRKIKCHDAGNIRLEAAIQNSCNTYFSRTYARIINKDSTDYNKGLDEWVDIMKSFGLGDYFGNDLAVGGKGNIPDSEYYKARRKEPIKPYSVFSNGIGQGEILLTPLQMANFTAAIANKGFFYTPHIVKEVDGVAIDDPQFTEPKYTKVDEKYFKYIWEGMKRVVLRGTARRIYTRSFTQMGKTGTAQNPNADHSLFVLAAPADNPTICIAAIVENGGGGSSAAAPIASVIAEKHVLGKVKRGYLFSRMKSMNKNAEYRRQWIKHLKKQGKWIDYIEPSKLDSMNLDPVNKSLILEAIRQKKAEEQRRKLKDSLQKIEQLRKDSVKNNL